MTRRNFSSNCVITTVFDESKISNSSKYNEKYFLYKIVIEKYFHNQYFRFIEYKMQNKIGCDIFSFDLFNYSVKQNNVFFATYQIAKNCHTLFWNYQNNQF